MGERWRARWSAREIAAGIEPRRAVLREATWLVPTRAPNSEASSASRSSIPGHKPYIRVDHFKGGWFNLKHGFTLLPQATTLEDIEALLPWNVVLPATQSVAT